MLRADYQGSRYHFRPFFVSRTRDYYEAPTDHPRRSYGDTTAIAIITPQFYTNYISIVNYSIKYLRSPISNCIFAAKADVEVMEIFSFSFQQFSSLRRVRRVRRVKIQVI